tara:strand:- start:42 stop:1079 length:1038 start_codon:yes stop_codon:yes gene_type:complete
MAYTAVNKSSSFMNAKTFVGNASNQAISGIGFNPDFVFTKSRTVAYGANLYDKVRGVGKFFNGITTGAEGSSTAKIASFDADGFTLKNGDNANYTNGQNAVAWAWKANGQGSANTAGSINTTYTSANTTSGFSIIKYNGNGSNNATIGHGLGVKPDYLIIKKLNGAENWVVQNSIRGFNKYMYWDTTNAENTHSGDFVASVSSTLITLGTNGGVNNGSGEYICYAFANKTGFCKSGQYQGNGNADGKFIYLGFRPTFFMVKKTTVEDWAIWDSKRDSFNLRQKILRPNTTGAESDSAGSYGIDLLSNGIKLRASDGKLNTTDAFYTYLAFGQTLVGTNGVPGNAA